MTEKYKYFCNSCGKKFESNLPEKDKLGLLNDIVCPKCGAYDIYADTEEGNKLAFKHFCEYENYINEEVLL